MEIDDRTLFPSEPLGDRESDDRIDEIILFAMEAKMNLFARDLLAQDEKAAVEYLAYCVVEKIEPSLESWKNFVHQINQL